MAELNIHAVAVLLLLVGTLFLFTRHKIAFEYSCTAILFVLVLGFELFPFERDGQRLGASSFLAGFGNEALITILLLLIMAKGVEVSGALQPLARLSSALAPQQVLVEVVITSNSPRSSTKGSARLKPCCQEI